MPNTNQNKAARINIEGTNIQLTEAIKEYTHKQCEKLLNHSDSIDAIEIHLGSEGKDQWFANGEIDIYGPNLHHKGKANDLYSAIKNMVDGLNRQLRIKHRKQRSKVLGKI